MQSDKKALRALRKYSTHLSEEKVQVYICPEDNTPSYMGDVRVISIAEGLCGYHAFQHNFQVFVSQRCALPGFTRTSWQAFSNRWCNMSKSLIGTEYTKVFKCPHSQKSRGLCTPVYWASVSGPLFAESLVQTLSDNAEKMRWFPIMHEPHVLPLMKVHSSKSTGKSFTKSRWYTPPVFCWVRQLVLRADHLKRLSRHWLLHRHRFLEIFWPQNYCLFKWVRGLKSVTLF
jgi:hypothetical protein